MFPFVYLFFICLQYFSILIYDCFYTCTLAGRLTRFRDLFAVATQHIYAQDRRHISCFMQLQHYIVLDTAYTLMELILATKGRSVLAKSQIRKHDVSLEV